MYVKKKKLKEKNYLRTTNVQKKKLVNNFVNQIEIKSQEQIIKIIDNQKIKLKKVESLIQQHLNYMSFHKIPLNQLNQNKDFNEIPRFHQDTQLFTINLKQKYDMLSDQLQNNEIQNQKLNLNLQQLEEELKTLRIQNDKERKKFDELNLIDLQNQQKKLHMLRLKEIRLKNQIEEILNQPYFSVQKQYQKIFKQKVQLKSDLETLKIDFINEQNIEQKLQEDKKSFITQKYQLEMNIEEIEKKLIHLNIIQQKKTKNSEELNKEIQINAQSYDQLVQILKEREQILQNTGQYQSKSFEELQVDYDQLQSETILLKKELEKYKLKFTNQNQIIQQDLELEKNEFLINKYEKDLEILYQIQDFFYDFSKQKHIGYIQGIGEDFIYSEGASVFEENINDSQMYFSYSQNQNVLELYFDKYHVNKQEQETGIVVEFMNFEEIFIEFQNQSQKLNYQKSYIINLEQNDLSNLINSKFQITLLHKKNNEIIIKSKGQISLWQLIRTNLQNIQFGYSNISYVQKDSCLLENEQQQSLGILDYRMRFKYPLTQNISQNLINTFENQRELKIKVKIYQCLGLNETGKYYTAVSFADSEIFTSQFITNKNPVFDFDCYFEVNSLECFQQETLNIRIFDDFKPLDQSQDQIGQVDIQLQNLQFQKNLALTYPIKLQGNNGSIIILIIREDFKQKFQDLYSQIFDNSLLNKRIQQIRDLLNTRKDIQIDQEKISKNYFLKNILQTDIDSINSQQYIFNNKIEFEYFWNQLVDNKLELDLKEFQKLFYNNKEKENTKKNQNIQQQILSQDKIKGLEELIEELKEQILKFQISKGINEKEIIEIFDEDQSGKMEINEFYEFCKKIKLDMKKEDINLIFKCLDRDGTGSLDSIEILKLIQLSPFDIINNRRLNVVQNKFKEYQYDKYLLQFIQQTKKFIKNKNLTKFEFFNEIKLEKEDQISQQTLYQISKDVFNLNIEKNIFCKIFNEIDKNDNGFIDYEEFCNFLELEQVFKILNKRENQLEMQQNNLFKILYQYIMDGQMNIEQFVEKVDINNDGQFSKYELMCFFKKIFRKKGLNFNVEEFERFIMITDTSKDKFISVQELNQIIKVYEKYILQPQLFDEQYLQELLNQVRILINEYLFRLKISFEASEDFPQHISIEKFKKIISEYQIFKKEDIDAIINPICLPFMKFLRINYQSFLKLEEYYKDEFLIISSQQQQQKISAAIDIFRMMKKIGNKYGYDNYLLFSMFENQNQGFLISSDIYRIFSEIGVNCSLEDINLAFQEMDLDDNEKISLREFCIFLDRIPNEIHDQFIKQNFFVKLQQIIYLTFNKNFSQLINIKKFLLFLIQVKDKNISYFLTFFSFLNQIQQILLDRKDFQFLI